MVRGSRSVINRTDRSIPRQVSPPLVIGLRGASGIAEYTVQEAVAQYQQFFFHQNQAKRVWVAFIDVQIGSMLMSLPQVRPSVNTINDLSVRIK